MERRDQFSLLLTVIVVGISILVIGGATRWAQSLAALATAVLVLSTVTSRRRMERWPPLLVLLAAMAAWTFVQWLPLPGGLVRSVTPTLEALRADGLSLVGISTPSRFSMDPAATLRALAFLLTLSGVAMVTLRLAISERGRFAIVACVAGLAGLAALITGLHELVGASSLYGLYVPSHGQPLLMAPLLNMNHLGGLMAIGVLSSAGLFMYAKQPTMFRVMWAVIGVGCLITTAATLSRGAILSLAAGFLMTLATLLAQRMHTSRGSKRRRRTFFATTVPIAVVIACSLVVAVYLGAGTVMHQLENTKLAEIHAPTSKFAAWKSTLALLSESPWVGVGRGAFEATFTRIHPASALATFSHPENEGLQAIVEWGVPAALIFAGLAIWTLLLALRRWNDGPLAAGVLGALVATLFQSNFDFGLELLGLAVPVTVLLATLSYVPLRPLGPELAVRIRVARIAHVAVILLGAIGLVTHVTNVVDEAHADLGKKPSKAATLQAIEQHPLDYFGYAHLAKQQLATGDPRAVRTLNHALRLHPTHPALHWMAAQLLVRANRHGQAEFEYAEVLRYSPDPRRVLTDMLAVLDSARAAASIPVEMQVDQTVHALAELKRLDVALLWLERVLATTGDLHAAETIYSISMQERNYRLAELASRRRCEAIPGNRCQLELARVLALTGKHAEIVKTLEDAPHWRGRADDQLAAWLMLCDAKANLGDRSGALDCLRRLEVSGLVNPGESDVERRRDALRAEHAPGSPAPPAQ